MPKLGVLITGFGGPDCPDAVEPFMCNLTGREPTPETVARVASRYEAIGGSSPLVRVAGELAEALRVALGRLGIDVAAAVGMRYWTPYIAEAVDALAEEGVRHLVWVGLTPFETLVTHGEYRAAIEEAVARHPGMRADEGPLLSSLPAYASLHADAARAALEHVTDDTAPIIFSAHSLPAADASADDSYVRGLEQCAQEVAASLGLAGPGSHGAMYPGIETMGALSGGRPWMVAYQSKGMRGGEWLGPDLDEVIDAAAAAGTSAVVVVPLGFATDHMETLYDLDVLSAGRAASLNVDFVRSAAPNASERLAADLAAAIAEILVPHGKRPAPHASNEG